MAQNKISLGIAIGVSGIGETVSGFQTLEQKTNVLGKALRQTWKKKNLAENVIDFRSKLQNLRLEQTKTGGSNQELNNKIGKTAKEYKKAVIAAKKYGVAIGGIVAEHKRLSISSGIAEKKLARLQTRIQTKLKRSELKGQIIGTVGLATTIAAPIKAAIDFESKMADVKKVVTFDEPKQFIKMGKSIRVMSTEMPMAASGIADIVAAAGQSGIAKNKLLDFAKTAVTMGVAFDLSGELAGKTIAGWRTGMALSQDEAVKLADSVNFLSNNLNAQADDLSEVIKRQGAVAMSAGLATTEIAALSAALLSPGTEPEIAATALKKVTGALTKGTAATKSQKDAFASLGFETKKLASSMQKDAKKTIIEVFEALEKIAPEERTAMVTQIFGEESKGAIMPLLKNLDNLKKAFSLVSDESKYTGSMLAEYEERSKTTANSIILFKNGTVSLAISLGTILLPPLNAVLKIIGSCVNSITDLSEKFPLLTKVIVGTAAALITLKVAALGGKFALTFLVDGLMIAKGAMDFFRISTIKTNIALLQNKKGMAGVGMAMVAFAKNPLKSITAISAALGLFATKTIPAAILSLRALSIAFLINPVGLAITGISLAVVGLALVIRKFWGPLKAYVGGVWKGLTDSLNPVVEKLKPVIDLCKSLGSGISFLSGKVGSLFSWFTRLFAPIDASKKALEAFATTGEKVGNILGTVLKKLSGLTLSLIPGLAPAVKTFQLLGSIWDKITGKKELPIEASTEKEFNATIESMAKTRAASFIIPETKYHSVDNLTKTATSRNIDISKTLDQTSKKIKSVNINMSPEIIINAAQGMDETIIAEQVKRAINQVMIDAEIRQRGALYDQ